MSKNQHLSTAFVAILAALAMQTAFSMDDKTDNAEAKDKDVSVSVHRNHGKHHFHFGRHQFRGHGIKVRDFGARKHYKRHHN